jgi:hypothetical protein
MLMSNQIQRYNAGSVVEATNTLALEQEADAIVDAALHRRGLRRLLPTRTNREIATSRFNLLLIRNEFSEKCFRLCREAELVAKQEILADCLIRGVAKLNRQRAVVVAEQFAGLLADITKASADLTAVADAAIQGLETLRSPALRSAREQGILNLDAQFDSIVRELVHSFHEALRIQPGPS